MNVNYEIKRALFKVTKCTIHKFTDYIYLLVHSEMWTTSNDNLPSSVGILGKGMLKDCHHSQASCSSELMRLTTALAGICAYNQTMPDRCRWLRN
jgi:hypothetical protein